MTFNSILLFFHKQITYVEQTLNDPTRALGNYGVKDGDVVVLRQADRRPPPTQPAFPGNTRVWGINHWNCNYCR